MVDLGILGVAPPAAPTVGAEAGTRPATIDRAASWRHRRAALRSWWDQHRPPSGDSAGRGSPGLHAVFTALAESHGVGWRGWPTRLQRHDDPAVARAAAEARDEVAFWHWVDEVADDQLIELSDELRGMGVTLMGDLPVGFDPNGFDAWIDRPTLVEGASIGAPPDEFNPAGQNWRLPPYSPVALLAAEYEPFLRTIRAQFRRYGGLRIDHVMGLFRLFWIPAGGEPGDGTYVRFRSTDLIDLVVLEATRAGAFVVGEDLGTVEPEVREAMRTRGIASTKVALFESTDAEHWPSRSLGTITTHDLPTVRGLLDDSDPWHQAALAERLRNFARVDADTDAAEVGRAAHRRLAASGSDLVLATLEDVVGTAARVNLPGTIDEYPNWRVPLPLAADELATDDFANDVIDAVADR
jgi:4-alpha-glucanotransferase